MKNKNFVFLLLMFISFFSCNERAKEKFNATNIEKEVKEMLLAYDDSVRKNGIEGELYFLDKSDAFYWVPPGYKYALHYDSIANILHEYATKYQYIDNVWKTLEIMPLSEKYASFSGVLNSTIITIENDTIHSVLFERGLVVKRNKNWKLLSGQTVVVDDEQ
jgi:hypothetical protein